MILRLLTGCAAAALVLAATPADAQILPGVERPLQRPLQRPLDDLERIRDRVDRQASDVDELPEDAADTVDNPVGDAASDTLDRAPDALDTTIDAAADGVAAAVDTATDTVQRALRPLALDIAEGGWPVEARTVVALVSDDELAAIDSAGLDVIEQRRLASLGRTLVTFREPTDAPLTTTLTTVRSALPDSASDLNHIYRLQNDDGAPASANDDLEPGLANDAPAAAGGESRAFVIGLIDSAVDASHFALRGSHVESRSFVAHDGNEPVDHGTAVASLIHAEANGEAGILSASVFFKTPNHAPGATTESLIEALDWLHAEGVEVINMSLAGPPNDLLEQAVGLLIADGATIVAAVGNNGPNFGPMYPAAYAGVIGATAVDRDRRIWLYANRGDYIDFAALGVNVKVADAGAGWRIESGTSMAAPIVSVVAAAVISGESLPAQGLIERLSREAQDLGQRGFDTDYGYGYLTRPPELISRRTQ